MNPSKATHQWNISMLIEMVSNLLWLLPIQITSHVRWIANKLVDCLAKEGVKMLNDTLDLPWMHIQHNTLKHDFIQLA